MCVCVCRFKAKQRTNNNNWLARREKTPSLPILHDEGHSARRLWPANCQAAKWSLKRFVSFFHIFALWKDLPTHLFTSLISSFLTNVLLLRFSTNLKIHLNHTHTYISVGNFLAGGYAVCACVRAQRKRKKADGSVISWWMRHRHLKAHFCVKFLQQSLKRAQTIHLCFLCFYIYFLMLLLLLCVGRGGWKKGYISHFRWASRMAARLAKHLYVFISEIICKQNMFAKYLCWIDWK